jgi:YbgC/YbaW family acyl-CoA thioester hydrolase
VKPQRQDFRYVERLRVRWAEVDMQKVVFNGHYLMYLDTAVAGWWRAMALPYEATLRHFDGDLFVRKATLEYHASAGFDETLDVGVRCTRIGNSSLTLHGGVFRNDTLLVGGELVYVFTEATAQVPQALPQALRALLEGYEAGETMLTLRTGDWSELADGISPIREEVFVNEQGIAAELVWDDADATAHHALACNRIGMPLAAGRLTVTAPGVGKIERMAASAVLRGSGAGRAVLEALVAAARARGDREVILHAQTSAAGFYVRHGFVTRGAVFQEVGIDHVAMARSL